LIGQGYRGPPTGSPTGGWGLTEIGGSTPTQSKFVLEQ
jgi:hypothetical protein